MSSRYERVKELFQAALDQPAARRVEFVEARCGDDTDLRDELVELLELHERDGEFLERELPGGAHTTPERIGPFHIVRKLGEGGMGTVFEAAQDNPRRTVALKLLRGGLASVSTLRRFEQEGHLLGRLHHPGIAQIYEAGTLDTATGTQPYFAMELVEGVPVLAYAQQRGLDTRARVGLVARVCDSIQHAHQRGVIHRDLKSENVLVDASGLPKVLDFGIAHDVGTDEAARATLTGQVIGTLGTMSPEQAAGRAEEIDTRTDVYSLGVMLYELLAGRPPLELRDRPMHAALSAIVSEEPPPLGKLDPELRGDLELIAERALAKEKERRYGSVSELADDLRRFLAHEPVTARAATTLYQLRKFARRHRALVTSALLLAVVVTAGFVVSSVLYVRAEERRFEAEVARTQAQQQAAQSAAVTAFLLSSLEQADPIQNPAAANLSVRSMFDQAAATIEASFRNDAGTEAAVRSTIGHAYTSLGHFDEALVHARRSLALRNELWPEGHDEVAESLTLLAGAQVELAEYDQALESIDRALDMRRRLHGEDHPSYFSTLETRASILNRSGDAEQARDLYAELLEKRTTATDPDGSMLPTLLNNLASTHHALGDAESARECLTRSLEAARELYGEAHPWVATNLNNLGLVCFELGETERGIELFREALDIRRRAFGSRHPSVAESLSNLGGALGFTGEVEESLALHEEAIELNRELLGSDHPVVATMLNNLGVGLKHHGHLAEAEERYQESLSIRRRALGPHHADIAVSLQNLAVLHQARNDYAAALPLARECLEIRRQVLPPEHEQTKVAADFVASLERSLSAATTSD